jgi:nitrogen regulatory protein P-II 1
MGPKGRAGVCRGHDCRVDLVPDLKLALVLFDNPVDTAIDTIVKARTTSKIGDGKDFSFQ